MLYHSLLLIAYEKFPLFCYLYFTFKFPFVKKLSVFLIRTCVRVWMLFSKHQLKHSLWLMKKHSLKILFIYFYREGKERRERNINVWFPLTCPQLGSWPATQACALTGNWTDDPLVGRPALNPLSYTSQGVKQFYGKFAENQTLASWSKSQETISKHLETQDVQAEGIWSACKRKQKFSTGKFWKR